VLLLLAIGAATTTLTLGLALNGVTSQHYAATRAATRGPDVVASTLIDSPGSQHTALAKIKALTRAPGVTAHSGPYPVTFTSLAVNGHPENASVMVEGRAAAPAAVDRPQVTAGSWIRPGEAVVERTFAGILGIRVGDRITLDGRSFRVAGIAVTAAIPPLPGICYIFGCGMQLRPFGMKNPGLVWRPESDARALATSAEPLSYLLNLKLAPGAETGMFATSCDNDDVNSPAPCSAFRAGRRSSGSCRARARSRRLAGGCLSRYPARPPR
jgi:putative ABC transport system permease protein